jgi:CBS domain-containing protein
MAEKGFTRIPVVERTTTKFLGLVSLNDLVKTRGIWSNSADANEPCNWGFSAGKTGS